jgi:hypothetical protein
MSDDHGAAVGFVRGVSAALAIVQRFDMPIELLDQLAELTKPDATARLCRLTVPEIMHAIEDGTSGERH